MTMHILIPGTLIGTATGCGLFLAQTMLPDQHISAATAVSVCVFVSGAVFWLSRTLQSIRDEAVALRRDMGELKTQISKVHDKTSLCEYCENYVARRSHAKITPQRRD